MFVVQSKFSAVVDDKEVTYRKGDKVNEEVAKKLGLADKPNLAISDKSIPTEE
ncbi:MAG: hypothetical protein Unbinned4497contig1000_28 [Prokaryotic dsDNA virus sp.]|jgi:hypothetical protein|nr:MAG: hypothetical protein Unbinned4497contig1000_28 [Prokaryotic dsDNA virus sp.]|tara:strand:+ start:14926 stop:15084 length:159 start_codon:yes stop_codon:yes gene_type:complete